MRRRAASAHVTIGANATRGAAATPTRARSIQRRDGGASQGPLAASPAATPATAPRPTASAGELGGRPQRFGDPGHRAGPGRRSESPRSRVARPRTKRAYLAGSGSSRCSVARTRARSASLAASPRTRRAGSPGSRRRAKKTSDARARTTTVASIARAASTRRTRARLAATPRIGRAGVDGRVERGVERPASSGASTPASGVASSSASGPASAASTPLWASGSEASPPSAAAPASPAPVAYDMQTAASGVDASEDSRLGAIMHTRCAWLLSRMAAFQGADVGSLQM